MKARMKMMATLLVVIGAVFYVAGCVGTLGTRFESVDKGNSFAGGHPYMALEADHDLINSRGFFSGLDHIIGWASLPLDFCIDTALLPLDLALSPFGFKKDHKNYSQKYLDRQRAKKEALENAYKDLQTALTVNPSIALHDKWYVCYGSMKNRIFRSSLKDSSVDYPPETLEAIYDLSRTPEIFLSRSCRVEFLVQNFAPAFERAENRIDSEPLASIVSNPKTPLELVKRVAESKTCGGAIAPAQESLKRRKLEIEKSVEKNGP